MPSVYPQYAASRSATLAQDLATTDSIIATAIETIPSTPLINIMPIVKVSGPTSEWVEPWFSKDIVELMQVPVDMYHAQNVQNRIAFSTQVADDIRKTYTPEAFVQFVQHWYLAYKIKKLNTQLHEVLTNSVMTASPVLGTTTADNAEEVGRLILAACANITRLNMTSTRTFSIIAPYSAAYTVNELHENLRLYDFKIWFIDGINRIYVFPTGSQAADRAGLALFEYRDAVQKTIDPETAEEVYFMYPRSLIVLNPTQPRGQIVQQIQV